MLRISWEPVNHCHTAMSILLSEVYIYIRHMTARYTGAVQRARSDVDVIFSRLAVFVVRTYGLVTELARHTCSLPVYDLSTTV